ncbi:hypothetical protein ATCC53582_01310 [Novacetimonas hansenii]|nr:hypothetical protein AA0243_1303 [Novacetimonas hansenii NRIC 0243]CUW47203.1 hypothetical protein ATCC53582_01310 [Novacetimonas hansenii]
MSMMNHQFPASNVIPLRQGFLPRHYEYLMRWLEAGTCMGLCDVDVASAEDGEGIEHVLVWVRENADPAYMIQPEGMRWVLIDQLRERRLSSYRSFEAALYAIRPVLSCGATAAA